MKKPLNKKVIFMFKYFLRVVIFAFAFTKAAPPATDITSAQLQTELKTIKQSKSWFNSVVSSAKILPKNTKVFRVYKENAPLLSGMIENLTKRLNMAQPALIFIMKDENKLMSNNAAAIGISHRASIVLIGNQLVKTLTPSALEAVIAHELGHLKKYHILKRAGYGIAVFKGSQLIWSKLIYPYFYRQYMNSLKEDNPLIRVLFGHTSPDARKWKKYTLIAHATFSILVQLLFHLPYSRMHEKEADMVAAHAINKPIALGEALQQLEKNNHENKGQITRWVHDKLSWMRMPLCVRRLMSTHPPTEDRVAYLQELTGEGQPQA